MAKRKGKRRDPVKRDDRVGPTPETAAKLVPDPFNVLVEMGLLDTAQRDAGLEIRAIWYAVTGGLMPKAAERSSARSGDGMSDELAHAHAQTYLPWCTYWGRQVEEVIDLVVNATLPVAVDLQLKLCQVFEEAPTPERTGNLGPMLTDYALRRRARPSLKRAA